MNRASVIVWAALNVPRLIGPSVEQTVAFTETRDGVRIAYATSGQGPPLVLVVGWASHLTEGLGSPLYDQGGGIAWHSRDHLVVRYDGRGFGLSERDIDDFSLDARVQDVEAVVDALDLGRFSIAGISSGGPTAIVYAHRHPDRVSHLVLMSTGAGRRTVPEEERAFTTDVYRARNDLIRRDWESPGTRALVAEFLAPQAPDAIRQVLMHFLHVSGNGPQVAGFFEATGQTNVAHLARELRVPTLVVTGSEDMALPYSRVAASLIPGARFEILQGADHIEAAVTDPRGRRLVSEFLADEPAR